MRLSALIRISIVEAVEDFPLTIIKQESGEVMNDDKLFTTKQHTTNCEGQQNTYGTTGPVFMEISVVRNDPDFVLTL